MVILTSPVPSGAQVLREEVCYDGSSTSGR